MVKTFKLDIESKYEFPHLWNCQPNYSITVLQLPAMEYYCYGGMMREKQSVFDVRYEKDFNTEFLLDEKLPEYCVQGGLSRKLQSRLRNSSLHRKDGVLDSVPLY
ncbi:hypothetical protein AAVH_06460 [Aphelenchoides avenae]|nr:hypothetical protein AAVH_06460 [Aphelenchus avenae]